MPVAMTTQQDTASKAERGSRVLICALEYTSGTTYAADSAMPIFWDVDGDGTDEEFVAVGGWGGVTDIETTTDGSVRSVTLTVTGVDPALVSLALADHYQGNRGRVWECLLDPDDFSRIGNPILILDGLMDAQPITLGTGAASISVVLVGRNVRWENSDDQPVYTDADHQSRFPGDTFFSRCAKNAAGQEITWGRT